MSRSIKELQEQKKRLEAEIAQQMNMEKVLVDNIDVFLALTPSHNPPYNKKGGRKHTDEHPYASKTCDRCLLLHVKNTKEWGEGTSVVFYINRPGEEEDEDEDPPKKRISDEDEDIDDEEDDD